MPVWCNWQTQLTQNQFKLRVRFSPQVLKILSGGVVVTHVTLTHTSQVRPLPGQPCSCDGNGRRSGLKIRCLKRRAGSNPVRGTSYFLVM